MVKRLSNTDQNGKILTGLVAPVSGSDAATKAYVDSLAQPYVGTTAPSTPQDGDMWWDTDDETPVGGGGGTWGSITGTLSDQTDLQTVLDTTIKDSDFTTNGIMKRTGAGTYGTAVAGTDYLGFSGTGKVTVGTSTPSSPSIGDLWVDTN